MDQPAVQRNYETLDTGYATYLGYQALHEANTHPVMLTAIQLFLSGAAGKRYRKRVLNDRFDLNQVDVKASDSDENGGGLLFKNPELRARWRWYLAFNLVKNPSLQNEHMKKISYLEAARKKKKEEKEAKTMGMINKGFV